MATFEFINTVTGEPLGKAAGPDARGAYQTLLLDKGIPKFQIPGILKIVFEECSNITWKEAKS